MLEKVRDEKREKSKEEEPQALAAQPIQRTEIEKCYFIGTLEAAEGQGVVFVPSSHLRDLARYA